MKQIVTDSENSITATGNMRNHEQIKELLLTVCFFNEEEIFCSFHFSTILGRYRINRLPFIVIFSKFFSLKNNSVLWKTKKYVK